MSRDNYKKIYVLATLIAFLGSYPEKGYALDAEPIHKVFAEYRSFYEKRAECLERESWRKAYAHSYKFLVSNEDDVPWDGWRNAIMFLLDQREGVLLREEADLKVAITLLGCDDSNLENHALDLLNHLTGHTVRARYAEEIKKALGPSPATEKGCRLLAKCGLTEQEKKQIVDANPDDVVLSALCGNQDAEAKLIKQFEEARGLSGGFSEMAELTPWLAFIGSERCIEALVDGLTSRHFAQGERLAVSSRSNILYGLRIIYEDKASFFMEVVENETPELIEQMNLWVREEFGHPAWDGKFVFFQMVDGYKGCFCNVESSKNTEPKRSDESSGVECKAEALTVDLGREVKMNFVPIPPGSFKMGSWEKHVKVNQMPVHDVTISQSFWMADAEVTWTQFRAVMGDDFSKEAIAEIEAGRGNHPVSTVSRGEAYAFCHKLTELEQRKGRVPNGHIYTLPTEAQWEYACRAGTTNNVISDIEKYAWTRKQYKNALKYNPVRKKIPNAWGLYDMLGNVPEWCTDCYHSSYYGAPTDGSNWGEGEGATCLGVLRGGSSTWSEGEVWISPAIRIDEPPSPALDQKVMHGFRPVLVKRR